MTTVRVPGKVLLSGEYAVLLGGTAVLVPARRRLRVSDAGDPAITPVVVQALGASIPELAAFEHEHGKLRVSLDRSEMLHDGVKLGIGSSAAEAVGVVALRFERAGLPWRERRERVLRLAVEAHARAQDGAGSGADVACCAMEAPIRYRVVDGRPDAAPLCGPVVLPLALAWTGKSADTREFVAAFTRWLRTGGETARGMADELVRLADRTAGAWTADESTLRTALATWHETMEAVAAAAGIEREPPEARTLREWAEARGGMGKPVGSGGGDVVLLVGDLPVEELPGPVIRLGDGPSR